jgi:hypothetical protein
VPVRLALAFVVASVVGAGLLPGQSNTEAGGGEGSEKAHRFGVTFTDTAPYVLRIDAAEGRSNFEMELSNADSVDRTVVLRLARGQSASADSTSVTELRFVPDHVVVPAGARALVQIELATLPQRVAGTWVAYAIAQDARSPRGVAVRQLLIVAPSVQPLVHAWNVRGWRWFPWPGLVHVSGGTGVVPLAVAIPSAPPPIRTHVVMLRDSGAGTVAWIGWADTAATTKDGTPGLALDVSRARDVGTYTATLPLDSLYNGSALNVRYTLTDAVCWPLIVLCIGVWAAYVSQDYFTVHRPALGVDERLAAVGERWEAIHDDLQNQVPASDYDISASVARRQAQLQAQSDALGETAFSSSTEQTAAYTKLADTVQAFADGVEAWAEVAPRLAVVLDMRKQIAADAKRYDPQGTLGTPSVLSLADTTVTGGTHEWDDGAKCVDVVKTLAATLDGWSQMLVRLSRDRILLEQIQEDGVANALAAVVKDAESVLLDAQARLWSARTTADLSDKSLVDALHGLETDLGKLRASGEPYRVTDAAATRFKAGELSLIRGIVGTRSDLIGTSPGKKPPTAAAIRASRRRYDLWFLLLAATVAVLSGLKVLYFGHPFGRPEDYLTAALWGFGTQLSLTTIADGLKRLAGATSLGIKV